MAVTLKCFLLLFFVVVCLFVCLFVCLLNKAANSTVLNATLVNLVIRRLEQCHVTHSYHIVFYIVLNCSRDCEAIGEIESEE